MSASQTLRFGGGVLVFLACASNASSHWQMTKWQMSTAEVKAIYPTAKDVPADRQQPAGGLRILLESDYSANGVTFDAAYYFDSENRLSMVGLGQSNEGACSNALSSMTNTYGSGVDVSANGTPRRQWLDEKSGNEIEFADIHARARRLANLGADSPACFITYKPLKAGISGL